MFRLQKVGKGEEFPCCQIEHHQYGQWPCEVVTDVVEIDDQMMMTYKSLWRSAGEKAGLDQCAMSYHRDADRDAQQ